MFAWLKRIFDRSADPVHSCDLYLDKEAGSCAHVDGPLCDFPECSMLADYRQQKEKRMADIVERLKDAENATHALFNHIFQDAREEIERLRIENEALRAEVIHIKEVEFPRKAQAVADGWRGKCERLEAKVAEMEQQEPVSWADAFGEPFRQKSEIDGVASPLYALPGAKGE